MRRAGLSISNCIHTIHHIHWCLRMRHPDSLKARRVDGVDTLCFLLTDRRLLIRCPFNTTIIIISIPIANINIKININININTLGKKKIGFATKLRRS